MASQILAAVAPIPYEVKPFALIIALAFPDTSLPISAFSSSVNSSILEMCAPDTVADDQATYKFKKIMFNINSNETCRIRKERRKRIKTYALRVSMFTNDV